jgi:hypothetical protein
MTTVYEWIREEVDEHGDIVNTEHFTTRRAAEAGRGETDAVGLTRDVFSEIDGLVDRLWAYVRPDGTLPSHFSNARGGETGYAVPKRYR